MPQYLVEYDARLWIDATDEDEYLTAHNLTQEEFPIDIP